MKQLTAHLVVVGLFLAVSAETVLAENIFLLWGSVKADGYSEAADWDTNQGYGETFITLSSGGWTEDSTCTPSACLNISSGVATPGGSTSTQSDASLFGIGGQYIFPTLIGQLITDSSADVTDLGILSDAKAEANTLLALTVDQTMQGALAGSYVREVSGESVTTASCWC